MALKKYIIGIDLGTTNCTMAYAEVDNDALLPGKSKPEITQFDIPQIVQDSVQGAQKTLQSLHINFALFCGMKFDKIGSR